MKKRERKIEEISGNRNQTSNLQMRRRRMTRGPPMDWMEASDSSMDEEQQIKNLRLTLDHNVREWYDKADCKYTLANMRTEFSRSNLKYLEDCLTLCMKLMI